MELPVDLVLGGARQDDRSRGRQRTRDTIAGAGGRAGGNVGARCGPEQAVPASVLRRGHPLPALRDPAETQALVGSGVDGGLATRRAHRGRFCRALDKETDILRMNGQVLNLPSRLQVRLNFS
jgi:hypothetical protein